MRGTVPPPELAKDLARPRIAVLDDRPTRVNLALRILAGARFRARGFTSRSDALRIMASVRFDAVLTDHRDGEHDAARFCVQLRDRLGEAAPPVLVVAPSVHDVAIPDRALFAGILIEPLSPPGLLESIRRVVGRARGPAAR